MVPAPQKEEVCCGCASSWKFLKSSVVMFSLPGQIELTSTSTAWHLSNTSPVLIHGIRLGVISEIADFLPVLYLCVALLAENLFLFNHQTIARNNNPRSPAVYAAGQADLTPTFFRHLQLVIHAPLRSRFSVIAGQVQEL